MERRIIGLQQLILLILLSALLVSGCATPEQNFGLGAAAATAFLSRNPSTEIEQTYYLGVFDPQEQFPPTVYRVRVHGQASALSATKFGTGWVKSDLIDSLAGNVELNGKSCCASADGQSQLSFQDLDRRLFLFGPEGFREAPKGHRLVIVMGSSPESYFSAIDKALGKVAEVKAGIRNQGLTKKILEAVNMTDREQELIDCLEKDVLLMKSSGKDGN